MDSHVFLWIPMYSEDSYRFRRIPMDSYVFRCIPMDSYWIPMGSYVLRKARQEKPVKRLNSLPGLSGSFLLLLSFLVSRISTDSH